LQVLLPDRESETLAKWLQAHPTVRIVSRDRAGAYAEGAPQGAPGAVQVADRFHLFCHLTQALQRVLERLVSVLRRVELTETSGPPAAPSDRIGAGEPEVQTAKEIAQEAAIKLSQLERAAILGLPFALSAG
jgi:transposase